MAKFTFNPNDVGDKTNRSFTTSTPKSAVLIATQVKKNYTHDRMSIKIKFASNATLDFSVNRNGERLNLAFSNNTVELKEQSKTVQKWLELRKNENNQERFNRLEAAARAAKSGKEFLLTIA